MNSQGGYVYSDAGQGLTTTTSPRTRTRPWRQTSAGRSVANETPNVEWTGARSGRGKVPGDEFIGGCGKAAGRFNLPDGTLLIGDSARTQLVLGWVCFKYPSGRITGGINLYNPTWERAEP